MDRWIPAHMRADPDTHRRARLLIAMSLIPLPVCIGFGPVFWLAIPQDLRLFIVAPTAALVPCCLAIAPLLRAHGSLALPLRVMLACSIAVMVALTFFSGGSQSTAQFWWVVSPSIAHAVGGRREGALCWAVVLLLEAGLLALDTRGLEAAPDFFHSPKFGLSLHLSLLLVVLSCFLLFQRSKETAAAALRAVHRELSRAQAEAQAASESKSAFLSRMSHRIRTPLMAILGFTELLLSERSLPEGDVEQLRTMKRNGEHLLHVVDDMIDLSRIEADSLELASVSLDPRALALEVSELLRARIEGKGLELAVELDGTLPPALLGDPTRLRQVLLNLLGNALKFTERGRILLRVSTLPSESAQIRFSIQDTGVGMSADDLPRLFQPFVQADSTARQHAGTGLGLAISRRLVEAMDGSIQVESRPGEGTRFDIDLPIRAAAVPAPLASSGSAASLDRRLCHSILIVDDTADHRVLLHRLLSSAGARVALASSGSEALRIVVGEPEQRPSFDLILMDLQMEELDGFETTRQLRMRGYSGRIVALSADATRETRERCLSGGFDDHATKPIARERLIELVGAGQGGTRISGQAPGSAASEPSRGAELESARFGWRRLVGYFVPRALRSDPEARSRAQMVVGVVTSLLVPLPCMSWIVWHALPRELGLPVATMIWSSLGLSCVVPFWMRASGSIALPAHAVMLFGIMVIGWMVTLTGGIFSFVANWLLAVPVIALAVLGRRAGALWAGAVSAILVSFVVLELRGRALASWVAPSDLTLALCASTALLTTWIFSIGLIYDGARNGALEMLADANRALARARDQAERASESKGRFLATLSHEIRTPMTAILGFAELLRDAWTDRSECAEAREMLRIVQSNSERLLRLINDLLDLSKLEAGRLQLEPMVFSPHALLHGILQSTRPEASACGVALSGSVHASLEGDLYDDPTRIRQILAQLIDNALQWSRSSEIDVSLEPAGPAQEGLVWVVRDRGQGLGESIAARLKREDAVEAHAGADAAGLGIPLCRGLSRLLGGQLRVAARPGGGTRVSVQLPRHPLPHGDVASATRDHEATAEPERSVRLPVRILVADDSADNQRLISHILRGVGAEVDVASNGREAIERATSAAAADGRYDVVLMDMQMPVLDGESAARELRRQGFESPIIAFTAEASAEVRQRALLAGCDELLSKPIDRRDLLETLARLVHAKDRR
jgi:signal transduction histidine kinase/DNA-binding response OmpR family regulator